jgi:hypothetical protein
MRYESFASSQPAEGVKPQREAFGRSAKGWVLLIDWNVAWLLSFCSCAPRVTRTFLVVDKHE